jgi:dTDP-4-dehydrorhamnose reductase
MTEKPFVHKKAFVNAKTSFLYQEDVAKILFKIINRKGIINVGGKPLYIYDFAKKDNKDVKKIYLKNRLNNFPKDSSINISKLKKFIKK